MEITGIPIQSNEPYIREKFPDGLPKTVSRLLLAQADCDLVKKAHLVHTALLAELGHGKIHSGVSKWQPPAADQFDGWPDLPRVRKRSRGHPGHHRKRHRAKSKCKTNNTITVYNKTNPDHRYMVTQDRSMRIVRVRRTILLSP